MGRHSSKRLIDQTPVHGNDPVESDFGGNTFDVDDGSFPGTDGSLPSHTEYWQSASLQHLGRLVTSGRP
ncbi:MULTISPECIES: hypothetical protein [unclassified Streptomyces]|uniref:hypothetical protein n=1 Tax=unclassified Streptomyces TaxID=2593676 RepID=UPI0003735A34|nr:MULTISPECIES: hypothetical protein [unclassified Streptomyces]